MEFQVVTNCIKEAIIGNNWKFAKDYKMIHACINHRREDHTNLKGQVQELQDIVHLQRTIINSCHNQTAALEEMVEQLVEAVKKLEGSICCCWDWLLSPCPHFAKGENQEVVADLEEDEEGEEDGLEYETEEEPLNPSRNPYKNSITLMVIKAISIK